MPINNGGEEFFLLLEKYKSNRCSKKELQQIYHYYNLSAQQQDPVPLTAGELAELEGKIWQDIAAADRRPAFRIRSIYRYAAACVVAICCLILPYIYYRWQPNAALQQLSKEEIQPGTSGATLTLPDGKVLSITDSSFSSGPIVTDQMQLSKDEHGALRYELKNCNCNEINDYSVLSTAQGQSITITLPDRSKIWLNAASRLSFSTNFNQQKNRLVRLQGEAYFDVAKNPDKPFIVQSDLGTTEVKGTAFNVNAYPHNNQVITTVTEGVVSVSNARHSQAIIKAGQQAIIKNVGISINNHVDTDVFSSWKDGYFTFNGSLTEALSSVERWYDVKISIQRMPKQAILYGKISRDQPIENILNILAESSGIHYKIDNKTVFIY